MFRTTLFTATFLVSMVASQIDGMYYRSDGTYKLVPQLAQANKLCLTAQPLPTNVSKTSSAWLDGIPVGIATCVDNSPDQRWTFSSTTGRTQVQLANSPYCLEAASERRQAMGGCESALTARLVQRKL